MVLCRYILLGCLPGLRVLLPVRDLPHPAGRGRLRLEGDLRPGRPARVQPLPDPGDGEGPQGPGRGPHLPPGQSARASEEDVLRLAGGRQTVRQPDQSDRQADGDLLHQAGHLLPHHPRHRHALPRRCRQTHR